MKIKQPYYYPMHKTICFVGYVSNYTYNNRGNSEMIQNIASEIEYQHFYHNMSYIIVNNANPFSILVFEAIKQLKEEFDGEIEIKAIVFIPFLESLELNPIKKKYVNTLCDMADEIYIVDDTERTDEDDDLIVEKAMIDKSQILITHNPTQTNDFTCRCVEYAKENNKDIVEKDFTPEYHVYKITVADSMTCYIKAKSQKDAEKEAINRFYEREPKVKTEIADKATPETTLF